MIVNIVHVHMKKIVAKPFGRRAITIPVLYSFLSFRYLLK